MSQPPFFILSCARSGSTSLARILDQAANGVCVVEPAPGLQTETRLAMEQRLPDPRGAVEEFILPRIEAGRAAHEVYGEKNVTYGPFIRILHRLTGGRFVFLRRDGRDVVRSLLDWHDRMFGTIYRECADPGDLSPRAVATAASLPVHHDASDFARPRPRRGSPLAAAWESMSRLEMCAYYWATINALYRDELERIGSEAWVDLDYTDPPAEDVLSVARFCGLRGLSAPAVQTLLDARINSVRDRCGEPATHPSWPDWDGGQRRRFEAVAGPAMERLGYFGSAALRWRPPGFGECWRARGADAAWYEWMYDGRRLVHEATIAWIRAHDHGAAPIRSIADFGCGLGIGYAEAFSDRRYHGFDLIEASTDWCRRNRPQPRHAYHHRDFVAEPPPTRYDLVMSSGTIDNAWDVEAFLEAMLRASRGWIYLTCYRGWFPGLPDHRYRWSAEHGCFYNDVSPQRVRAFLAARGAREITVEPLPTGGGEIPFETRIIARVPAGGPVVVTDRATPAGRTSMRRDAGGGADRSVTDDRFALFLCQVRANYAHLANPFSEYERLLDDLEALEDTRILPLFEFAEAPPGRHRLVALRHDIDGDPVTALRMARCLARRGIGGSFYLLHTAGYYGCRDRGRFRRNPALAGWVRSFIVSGCELGVHNDALGAMLEEPVDGPAALVAEIDWLRQQGAVIRGTVAHNSAPAYGAANSEVFVGRRLAPGPARAPDGRPLPLEVLDERELELAYEGTFAVASPQRDHTRAARFVGDRAGASLRSAAWMRTFLLENPAWSWAVDLQLWLIGPDEWVVAGRPGGVPRFLWCASRTEAVRAIASAPRGSRALVVLHPVYYGGE